MVYDLAVIGAGPSGEAAAMAAAKSGLTACLIDANPKLGGNSTHVGTIPSKSLRNVVENIKRFKKQPLFRNLLFNTKITFPQVLEEAMKVIPKQVEMHTKFFIRNDVEVIRGYASFIDKNTLEVAQDDGSKEKINAKNILIATGSRPYRPDDIDFDHPRVYDSDAILKMQHHPRTLIIIGAGVIGCEYASIFSGLGIKVDLINSRDRLLSFLDDEITDALSYHLRENGVMVRHNEMHETISATDEHVEVLLQSGKKIRGDALLWCTGRSGNTHKLNLENIGLEANHRGQLAIEKSYRTSVENVYAAGDVVGWPSLASASYDQGRAVISNLTNKAPRFIEDAPTGIYTLPEISSVGRTERELTQEKVPYEVGRAFFKDTARGKISNEDVGMLKILFHTDTLEILGIHCFGAAASEIIHIGQAIMYQPDEDNTIEYFVNTTFNYPTMAEAYRIAALNGLNRITRD